MVLVRLCHVSDLPSPAELVRRLGAGGTVAVAAVPAPSGEGGGTRGAVEPPPSIRAVSRAVATGGVARAAAVPVADTADPGPVLNSFRDVAALVKDQREAMLHAHLLHSTHLVRFTPPVIELRTEPDAPRELAAKLAALLTNATGERWTIALSTAAGEPTLAEQGNAADAVRREAAADHPLIRAILTHFPGARIDSVHDSNVDDYGLPNTPPVITLGEPDLPEFAPPDAEFSDNTPWESEP
jgi:DNA polymerase-3 subunit gamma/tau